MRKGKDPVAAGHFSVRGELFSIPFSEVDNSRRVYYYTQSFINVSGHRKGQDPPAYQEIHRSGADLIHDDPLAIRKQRDRGFQTAVVMAPAATGRNRFPGFKVSASLILYHKNQEPIRTSEMEINSLSIASRNRQFQAHTPLSLV
jgi:hypothetical protein